MTSDERKHRIEAYLQRVEFASLEELSQHVEASVSTVRRDLTTLEAAGNLRGTHGGARLITPQTEQFVFFACGTTGGRDLTTLEAAGNLRRTHGGARIITPKTDEFAFSARDAHQLSEKEAIGKACAELRSEE